MSNNGLWVRVHRGSLCWLVWRVLFGYLPTDFQLGGGGSVCVSVCQGIPEPPPHFHTELRSDLKTYRKCYVGNLPVFQELDVRCGNKLPVFVPMCFVCEYCVGECEYFQWFISGIKMSYGLVSSLDPRCVGVWEFELLYGILCFLS